LGEVELAWRGKVNSLTGASGEKGRVKCKGSQRLKKSSGKRVDRVGKADKLVAAILSVL